MSAKDLKEDYKTTFSSDAGRRVLLDLIGITGVERSVFSGDTHQNSYNQGQQAVGFHIVNQLKDTSKNARSNSPGDTRRPISGERPHDDTEPRNSHIHPKHGRHIP